MFSEFVKEIVKELEAKESRKRARSADAQSTFSYAVGYIVKKLWRDTLSYPPRESSINMRSGYYSELERYRDPQLTYRQVKAAFDSGLITREQFDSLAVAINTGTNIPSIATPNGQAAFLFLLTSSLAPLINLSYMRMVLMALPYTIILSIVGFLSIIYLL